MWKKFNDGRDLNYDGSFQFGSSLRSEDDKNTASKKVEEKRMIIISYTESYVITQNNWKSKIINAFYSCATIIMYLQLHPKIELILIHHFHIRYFDKLLPR